jgi:hypothetical protein
MSHANYVKVNVDDFLGSSPLSIPAKLKITLWIFLAIGLFTFCFGLLFAEPKHFWGVFYVCTLQFLGISFGALMPSIIFQIVRAKWSATLRRISEAHIAFVPWALLCLFVTYLGKDSLFPWASKPMPGREIWMSTCFVYGRFFLLFGLLYFLFRKFVCLSLRSDAGFIEEQGKKSNWASAISSCLTKNWKGSENEIKPIQVRLSNLAPVIVLVYAVTYSLFAFEMIMGMDTIWYSNMFGGFQFVGNIGQGWAVTALMAIFISRYSEKFAKVVNRDQLWDLGKLQFGFTMLWGYMFFSQYLPQWYGNLPEETAWMLTRVRGEWMPLSYFVLGACFIVPFILLLSEDLKKTPWAYATVACIILIGYWFEKYAIVMPQLFPHHIPLKDSFGIEIGLWLGFVGAYGLSIQSFLTKYPYIPVSHPLTRGSNEW